MAFKEKLIFDMMMVTLRVDELLSSLFYIDFKENLEQVPQV